MCSGLRGRTERSSASEGSTARASVMAARDSFCSVSWNWSWSSTTLASSSSAILTHTHTHRRERGRGREKRRNQRFRFDDLILEKNSDFILNQLPLFISFFFPKYFCLPNILLLAQIKDI